MLTNFRSTDLLRPKEAVSDKAEESLSWKCYELPQSKHTVEKNSNQK